VVELWILCLESGDEADPALLIGQESMPEWGPETKASHKSINISTEQVSRDEMLPVHDIYTHLFHLRDVFASVYYRRERPVVRHEGNGKLS